MAKVRIFFPRITELMAHTRGVQPAGEQEAQGSVRVQPFIHRRDQLVADVAADGLQVIGGVLRDGGEIRIADKFSVRVIVSRREGADPLTQPHQVFRFAWQRPMAPERSSAVVQGRMPMGSRAAMSSSRLES